MKIDDTFTFGETQAPPAKKDPAHYVEGVVMDLSLEDALLAAHAAAERRIRAVFKRRKNNYGYKGSDDPKNGIGHEFFIEVQGTAGELVVARYLDLPYAPTVGALDTEIGDVVAGKMHIQVKTTHYPTGHLIVPHNSDPNHYFALVVGVMPNYRLVGYVKAKNAMKPAYWKNLGRQPQYCVPQQDLLPPSRLKGLATRQKK